MNKLMFMYFFLEERGLLDGFLINAEQETMLNAAFCWEDCREGGSFWAHWWVIFLKEVKQYE
jgi:hypothetical protein